MCSFRGGGLIIWSLQSRAWWSENNVSTRASLSTLSVCRDMMKSRVWPLEWVGSVICCSRPNVSRISANCTRSWFWRSSQWILKSPIMTRRPYIMYMKCSGNLYIHQMYSKTSVGWKWCILMVYMIHTDDASLYCSGYFLISYCRDLKIVLR